jgi:hypothetical protein
VTTAPGNSPSARTLGTPIPTDVKIDVKLGGRLTRLPGQVRFRIQIVEPTDCGAGVGLRLKLDESTSVDP